MIVFVLLIIDLICFIIGFGFLIINVRKLNIDEINNTEKQEMPFYLKRSFQFLAVAFLLLVLISLIIPRKLVEI